MLMRENPLLVESLLTLTLTISGRNKTEDCGDAINFG
jgi:hypothetical protein